jgi:hypothetical protein
MATEDDRILKALETLRRAGLLAQSAESRAELAVGDARYRCLPAFWEAVGAVPPGTTGFEQQLVSLRDPFVRANLHHRVMAELLVAGAPLWWCHEAADAALGSLRTDAGGGGPSRAQAAN